MIAEGIVRRDMKVSRGPASAQYFFSGAQTLLSNLHDAENATKRDQLLQLGGQAAIGSAAMSGQVAYLYLKLPHNSCRASGKPLPFPSDLNNAAAAA